MYHPMIVGLFTLLLVGCGQSANDVARRSAIQHQQAAFETIGDVELSQYAEAQNIK